MASVLRSFGPNSIIVFKFPVGPRTTDLTPEERTRKNLTYQNAVDIKERCRDGGGRLLHAVPQQRHVSTLHYKGNDMYDVNLFGVEEAYARRRTGGHASRAASSPTKRAGASFP